MQMKAVVRSLVLATALMLSAGAHAADVICYGCSPQSADWPSAVKAIKTDLGLEIALDNKESGQALTRLLAESDHPVADFAYLGVTSGTKAKQAGVLEPYRLKGLADVAPGLRDPDGNWTAVHSGTLGLFVNKQALGDKKMPACWSDLFKPEYRGMIGYLDPSAAVVGAVAVNLAIGGTLNDFDPVISYFKALQANAAIVLKQPSYVRVVSGEIPIVFDYDFNAYRAKDTESGKFEFVLPCEGSVVFPYVVGLIKNAPHRAEAERVLDYLLSERGQLLFSRSYLRPARPAQLPTEISAKFLRARDYRRAVAIDWEEAARVETIFIDLYRAQIQ
jgi:putative spermidine/putrescine transport system substrate-binding protein